MIRVLHVLNELRASGVEQGVLRAAPLWREANISTAVVATGAEVGPWAARFREAGIPVYHVPYRPRPGYVLALARLCRAEADIVQFHTERAFIYSEVACRLVGNQVVHSPCSEIRIGGPWRYRRMVQRWLARRMGIRMVSTSDSVQENEQSWFRNPTTLVRNYINDPAFIPGNQQNARRAFELPQDAVVFSTVGNCLGVKNHPSLLEALARWGSARHDWFFLHAGHELDGSERNLAEQLGIADRCRYLGPLDDVSPVLHASDVFVMPSLNEGLGNAALEAACAGLTMVLTDVSGLRDLKGVVSQGRWTATDPASIAAGLGWAAETYQEVTMEERWAQRDAVIRRYGLARGVREYADLYRDLASGHFDRRSPVVT